MTEKRHVICVQLDTQTGTYELSEHYCGRFMKRIGATPRRWQTAMDIAEGVRRTYGVSSTPGRHAQVGRKLDGFDSHRPHGVDTANLSCQSGHTTTEGDSQMMTITFRQAADAGACSGSVRRMAEHLGGIGTWGRDTPIPLTTVLDVLGPADTAWALGALGESGAVDASECLVGWACDCAERALRYVPEGERRPHEAVRVARLWVRGLASTNELHTAADAAYAAADAAYADAAAYAADAAAATAAAYAAADAAAADAAAAYAAAAAEREWQKQRLRQYLIGEATP